MAPLPRSEYLSDVWKDDIFANKVVFCTGGAGTICSAQVRALVHLGADACIIGRNEEKTGRMAAELATARPGARVLGLGGVDVRDAGALRAAADRCARDLGGIDFVIAGAAGNFLASLDHLSTNAFKSVMDIDVLGSYNTVKATLPYLKESASNHRVGGSRTAPGTGGRILFISATFHYSGAPLQTHVMAAKAAVDALAAAVALEQGPRGITANVIAPGPIEHTEGMERLARQEGKAKMMRQVPLGRWGSVKDVADATVYLFSDAGNFVNGAVLVVDGAAWRITQTSMPYPDAVLATEAVAGVKGGKKEKNKEKEKSKL